MPRILQSVIKFYIPEYNKSNAVIKRKITEMITMLGVFFLISKKNYNEVQLERATKIN